MDFSKKSLWAETKEMVSRLEATAERWPEDREIQLRRAQGAYNVLCVVPLSRSAVFNEAWSRPEAIARSRPFDLEIQEIASRIGVGPQAKDNV